MKVLRISLIVKHLFCYRDQRIVTCSERGVVFPLVTDQTLICSYGLPGFRRRLLEVMVLKLPSKTGITDAMRVVCGLREGTILRNVVLASMRLKETV